MRTIDTSHIYLIICCNEKPRAIELILANGYAHTQKGAEEIYNKINKK